MTHESVVTLFEDVAKALGDSVRFGYGAIEDFNSIQNKEFPYIWLYPLKGEFLSGDGGKLTSSIEFQCDMNFLVMDSTTGADFETAQAWDKAFQLMEQYIHKLDEFSLTESTLSDLVELDRVNFEAGRKATGDALTGWKLNFLIRVPTGFDYCSIYA